MNYTYLHTASEPISERDSAWLEELVGSIERGHPALLSQQPSEVSDNALSLIATTDAGQSGRSSECERLVRQLLKFPRSLEASENAVILTALARSGHAIREVCAETVHEAIQSLLATQNRDGGWSAFDPNTKRKPSCPAVTAQVLEALGHFGFCTRQRLAGNAVRFLLARQDENGSWPGACTWQVLVGLSAVGDDMSSLVVRRAVRWLKESQNEDGGWGEGESTTTQTACTLIGLLSADEWESPEVRAGAEFLVGTQRASGEWNEQTRKSMCFALAALGRYATATGVKFLLAGDSRPTEIHTRHRHAIISA